MSRGKLQSGLGRAAVWAAHVGCGLVLAAGAVSALGDEPSGPPREDAKLESPAAELARAVELKGRARKLKGAERVQALESALAAYRSIEAHWPEERAFGAEAAFRCGELLRRLDRDSESRASFARAKELGGLTSFGARASLELAHASRRASEFDAAKAEFDALARDERAERRYRDDAALWSARMDAELGHADVARRAFEVLAQSAESALDRIEAYDEWCVSFVEAGDLEAAAGVLARCREALRDVSEEETPLGERVRNALTKMSSVRRLERAVRAREEGVTMRK